MVVIFMATQYNWSTANQLMLLIQVPLQKRELIKGLGLMVVGCKYVTELWEVGF